MSNFRGVWINLLSDAVTAARAALRRLDRPEIPTSLQRVAAYSGGTLPPPLVTSLLDELDSNEWLRGKALEEWEGDSGSPAGLFLIRPEGWWVELALAAGAAGADRGESRRADLTKQLGSLEEKLRRATDKANEYKKRLDGQQERFRVETDAARKAIAARYEAQIGELVTRRTEAAELTGRLEELESEHQELQDAFANLRSRFARTRRLRLDTSTASGPGGSMPSDPVKLARLLDLQTASFGRAPLRDREPERRQVGGLSLDAGVRPDSADAIRWLLALPEAVVVLVDGYNAQFHINRSDFTSGSARRNLVAALRRLRKASDARHRIVVVFDSTLPGERVARSSVDGVEVRFTEQDIIADEEIVTMAGQLDRVVVISSDREVREGSEDGGAIVLWSEALAEWMERL